MAVKVEAMLVSQGKYNIKCPYQIEPDSVTVHNTANDSTAEKEVKYMISNSNQVSFHYAVDDEEVVQGIPENRNAWHAGDGNGRGNRGSIAVEICFSKSGGDRFMKAERNAAEFIAGILKRRGWGIDRVKKHQDWSGKYCPHRTLDMGWQRFLDMVSAFLSGGAAAVPSVTKPISKPAAPDKTILFTYAVKLEDGTILPAVTNLSGFAGIRGKRIAGIAIKANIGRVKYRVHVMGKGWLPWVTGYNWSDHANGYAGNGRVIDAVQVYYETPKDYVAHYGYQKAQYRVSPLSGEYYPWQFDAETGGDQDGFAGCFGKAMDRFQLF